MHVNYFKTVPSQECLIVFIDIITIIVNRNNKIMLVVLLRSSLVLQENFLNGIRLRGNEQWL